MLLGSIVYVIVGDAEERGGLQLKRTKDLGKTFTTIHEDVFSFGYIGAFLFFSVMADMVRRTEKTLVRRILSVCCRVNMLYHKAISRLYLCLQRSPRVMYFSSDQGKTFSRALLPSASTEQVKHSKQHINKSRTLP